MNYGLYLVAALVGTSLILWPKETLFAFYAIGIKAEVYYLNYRMKWMAWRLHRTLTKFARESGFPSPGPFKFVDLWDRES